MNFLAHFHLAWPDEGLVAGGLEGDYYKGPLRGDLPADIERGVRLHRSIDAYTDSHPEMARLREQFPQPLRRYAGILIDLSFDHFLSRHWTRFSQLPQGEFRQQIYAILTARQQHLSAGSRRMTLRLIEYDILRQYSEWSAIAASAERIGTRFTRKNPFRNIDPQLNELRSVLEQGFIEFYPQLQQYSARQVDKLNHCSTLQSNIAPETQTR